MKDGAWKKERDTKRERKIIFVSPSIFELEENRFKCFTIVYSKDNEARF